MTEDEQIELWKDKYFHMLEQYEDLERSHTIMAIVLGFTWGVGLLGVLVILMYV